eukprot:EG_transcript_20728
MTMAGREAGAKKRKRSVGQQRGPRHRHAPLQAPASRQLDLPAAHSFAHHVPVFQPHPRLRGLQYSPDLRRCRRGRGAAEWLSAIARDGLEGGRPQFTVRVVDPGGHLMVGVALADASRTNVPYYLGLFLSSANGLVYSTDCSLTYTTKGCFPSGCRVTMRLDFAAQTASYEVDGQNLGVVPCLLPTGPLYPALVLYDAGEEAEFMPDGAA